MPSWKIVTLLLLATCCADSCQAYNYNCLPDNRHSSVAIAEVQLVDLKIQMPGCRGYRHHCKTLTVMFTNRTQPDSVVYILVANWEHCNRYLDHIVHGLQNPATELTYSNLDSHCTGITVGKTANWMLKGYIFNGLLQCLENICEDDGLPRAEWKVDQRRSCRQYYDE